MLPQVCRRPACRTHRKATYSLAMSAARLRELWPSPFRYLRERYIHVGRLARSNEVHPCALAKRRYRRFHRWKRCLLTGTWYMAGHLPTNMCIIRIPELSYPRLRNTSVPPQDRGRGTVLLRADGKVFAREAAVAAARHSGAADVPQPAALAASRGVCM